MFIDDVDANWSWCISGVASSGTFMTVHLSMQMGSLRVFEANCYVAREHMVPSLQSGWIRQPAVVAMRRASS